MTELNHELIKRGFKVMFIDNHRKPIDDTSKRGCLLQFKHWLRTGETSPDPLYYYFGTKNYDRWINQRCEHQYGFAPSHGYLTFEIGLNREYRAGENDLSTEDKEACIYVIDNIDAILKESANAR